MLIAVLLIGSTVTTGHAMTDDGWSEDATASVAESIAADRDMLLLFTGSDWCPPCIQLETNILGHDDFMSKLGSQFVLLKLDFPRNTDQAVELQQQNSDWAKRLGVTSYPTLVLLDSKQRPFAFTGFRELSPDEYFKHLEDLKTIRVNRDELFSKADAAEGAERASLLDQALSLMTTEIVELYYDNVIEEIVSLDQNDAIGLRSKYYAAIDKELRRAVMTDIAIATRLRNPDDAIKFIDEQLAEIELPIEMKLQALNYKLQLLSKQQRFSDAIALLDQMIAIPELTPVGIQRLIVKKVYLLVGQERRDAALELLNTEIKQRVENLMLVVAKGELLDSGGDYQGAITAYDQSLTAAASQADMLIELVGAKSDALVELDKIAAALDELDQFAANSGLPADLRAEALVHKAMIQREQGETTAALRSESRALEIVENRDERAQIQRLIDQIRVRGSRSSN